MGLGWSRNLTDSLSFMEQTGLSRDHDGFLGTLAVDSRLQMVLFSHWYHQLTRSVHCSQNDTRWIITHPRLDGQSLYSLLLVSWRLRCYVTNPIFMPRVCDRTCGSGNHSFQPYLPEDRHGIQRNRLLDAQQRSAA